MALPAAIPSSRRILAAGEPEWTWRTIRRRVYLGAVMAAGGLLLVQAAARAHLDPLPTVALTVAAVMLSLYKLKLPLASGTSTMSMAATVDFVALLTAGVELATLVAAIAVLLQCTVRVPRTQPLYRSAFSVASVVLSVQAAGLVWRALQGDVTTPTFDRLLVPLSAAATAYFVVNTALVAGAIALSFSTSPVLAWNRDFLWSAPGYFLAAAVGATVALIMVTAAWELLPLAVSPLYISYRAYQISVRRLEEERWHAQELAKLVNATRQALARATQSEAALAAEKERLALESARLRVTVQAINDAVITVDRMGAVLLMNDRARSLASMKPGAAPAGEMGAIFEVLALPPGMYESTLERLLVGGYPVRLRNEPLDQGANIPLVEITGTPTRDQDGRVAGAVWVVRDITDAERIAQERAKAARLESLGVLAGGLAHDFNNILMGIVGNLSLAQGLVRPEESALALRLAQAAAACARARGVTNQLLTFAKGGTPVKKSASLRELVLECTRFALSGSTVAPRFDVAPDLWACDIDHVQIGQVVHNLVLNAVQATPRDGIVEVAMKNVVLSATTPPAGVDLAPGKYVQLTVRDHGDGILPQHLGRIFDPYFTTKKRGSGLGLAISYSIVKAHGGAITAASEPGSGSTFSVFLPASAQPAHEAPPAAGAALRRRGGRVLLMDDDDLVAEVAQEMLASLGYDAEVASSGSHAIEKFRLALDRGEPFDAVILDLTVAGGMGGGEALPHIRRLGGGVRVLVMSGYADDAVLARFREHGFNGVLRKPFTMSELQRALGGVD